MIVRPSMPALNRPRQRGMAVLIVLALLALMTLLIVFNSQTLSRLKQEIRLLEDKQRRPSRGSSAASGHSTTNRVGAMPLSQPVPAPAPKPNP